MIFAGARQSGHKNACGLIWIWFGARIANETLYEILFMILDPLAYFHLYYYIFFCEHVEILCVNSRREKRKFDLECNYFRAVERICSKRLFDL